MNKTRWNVIEQLWQDYIIEYGLLAIIFFVLLGFWVFGDNLFDLLDDRLGYITNVFTELLSIIVTVFVLDRLNGKRIDRQELARLKALLGSTESVVTKIAIAELRAKGWLTDGALKHTDLWGANLQGASLSDANLQETSLRDANLQNARLWRANLQGAFLRGTDLSGTSLWHTNLQGADLTRANLQLVNFFEAICDETTILPDGTYWQQDTNWSHYGAVEISTWQEWLAYRKANGLN